MDKFAAIAEVANDLVKADGLASFSWWTLSTPRLVALGHAAVEQGHQVR